jgi:chromosome segregation ATPase
MRVANRKPHSKSPSRHATNFQFDNETLRDELLREKQESEQLRSQNSVLRVQLQRHETMIKRHEAQVQSMILEMRRGAQVQNQQLEEDLRRERMLSSKLKTKVRQLRSSIAEKDRAFEEMQFLAEHEAAAAALKSSSRPSSASLISHASMKNLQSEMNELDQENEKLRMLVQTLSIAIQRNGFDVDPETIFQCQDAVGELLTDRSIPPPNGHMTELVQELETKCDQLSSRLATSKRQHGDAKKEVQDVMCRYDDLKRAHTELQQAHNEMQKRAVSSGSDAAEIAGLREKYAQLSETISTERISSKNQSQQQMEKIQQLTHDLDSAQLRITETLSQKDVVEADLKGMVYCNREVIPHMSCFVLFCFVLCCFALTH